MYSSDAKIKRKAFRKQESLLLFIKYSVTEYLGGWRVSRVFSLTIGARRRGVWSGRHRAIFL